MSTEPVVQKGKSRRRILYVVLSIVLLVFGIVSTAGGAVLFAYNAGTDSEGFTLSEPYVVGTSANAFAVWVRTMRLNPSYAWLGASNLVSAKWVVASSDSGQEIFVGWAKAVNGEAYLSGFGYEAPDQNWHWYTEPYYAEIEIPSTGVFGQGVPTRPPAQENVWMTSISTNSSGAIYWSPVWNENEGMDILVIMNADGSSNVNAIFQLGFKVPIFGLLSYLLIVLGIVLCLVSVFVFRRRKRVA